MRHTLKALLSFSILSLALGTVAMATRNDVKEAKAAQTAFLEANKEKEGIITTRSGLQYEVLHKGKFEERPRGKDTVILHYHGALIDGRVFESSVENGQPITLQLWDSIAGWIEGIKLMSINDKFRFYVPSKLAYGSTPKATIPAYSTLIFEIELIAIKRK